MIVKIEIAKADIRGVIHIAELYGVNSSDVRRAAHLIKQQMQEGGAK